jgi:hypothetical protein
MICEGAQPALSQIIKGRKSPNCWAIALKISAIAQQFGDLNNEA